MNIQKQRTRLESAFVVAVTVVFGLAISVIGALALKYQIALAVGLFGLLVICLVPEKRTLCLCLWVLIQPLSIEKILYTAPPLWPSLRGLEIVFNAGDAVLLLLFVVLLGEKIVYRKPMLIWNTQSKLFAALLLWGIFSYGVHWAFLHSPYVESAPLGILHLLRNLAFVLIIGSAIQTRADLIWVCIAVMVMIMIQSILVGLSFATGEAFNFLRLIGAPIEVQKYSVDGQQISRASGTLGVPNQQAMFHAMFTFLLLGLLSAKNVFIRYFALMAMLLSFVSVLFTFSRSAWLSIAVATLMIMAIFIKRREVTQKVRLMGSLLTFVFIAVLSVLAQPIIERLTKGDDGATDSRVRMISLAKDLAEQHPIIGVGPHGFVEAGLSLYPPGQKETQWVPLGDKPIVPPLGRIELSTQIVPNDKPIIVPLAVHNKYLLTLSELGIVGLVLWLAVFKTTFNEAKTCSRARDPLLRFTGVAGLAVILVALIYMMLDLFADDKTMQTLLFPLIVVSAAYRLLENNTQRQQ